MLSGFELYPRWVPLFRSGSADERKKRESSEKSVKKKKKKTRRKLSPTLTQFFALFSLRCLHYLGAWNTLNFGSRAGHLSGRSDHRAQKSYL